MACQLQLDFGSGSTEPAVEFIFYIFISASLVVCYFQIFPIKTPYTFLFSTARFMPIFKY